MVAGEGLEGQLGMERPRTYFHHNGSRLVTSVSWQLLLAGFIAFAFPAQATSNLLVPQLLECWESGTHSPPAAMPPIYPSLSPVANARRLPADHGDRLRSQKGRPSVAEGKPSCCDTSWASVQLWTWRGQWATGLQTATDTSVPTHIDVVRGDIADRDAWVKRSTEALMDKSMNPHQGRRLRS